MAPEGLTARKMKSGQEKDTHEQPLLGCVAIQPCISCVTVSSYLYSYVGDIVSGVEG